MVAALDDCRAAGGYGMVRDIPRDERVGSNDAVGADPNIRQDDGIEA